MNSKAHQWKVFQNEAMKRKKKKTLKNEHSIRDL